jgi:hypothetical protein
MRENAMSRKRQEAIAELGRRAVTELRTQVDAIIRAKRASEAKG